MKNGMESFDDLPTPAEWTEEDQEKSIQGAGIGIDQRIVAETGIDMTQSEAYKKLNSLVGDEILSISTEKEWRPYADAAKAFIVAIENRAPVSPGDIDLNESLLRTAKGILLTPPGDVENPDVGDYLDRVEALLASRKAA